MTFSTAPIFSHHESGGARSQRTLVYQSATSGHNLGDLAMLQSAAERAQTILSAMDPGVEQVKRVFAGAAS
jgi:hypothetical protein